MTSPPKRWFRLIQGDLGNIPDALDWYISALDKAYAELNIAGTLVRAHQSQPGYVAYYDAMHTDLDAILEFVQQKHRIARAKAIKALADAPPTNMKISAADVKVLADSEPDVLVLEEIVTEVKYVYKQFGSLLKALEQRGYTLTNITKLRIAGMEEVVV